MTTITNDVHRQFAELFPEPSIRPFAYLLSQRLVDGHICIQPTEALHQAPYMLESLPNWNDLHLWVGQTEQDYKPFILANDKLYLHRYFQYESNVINQIKYAVSSSHKSLESRRKLLLKHLDFIRSLNTSFPELTPEIKNTTEATDWQLAGALKCMLSDFSILTGGPGTGKTTTLAKVLKIYHRLYPEHKVHLAAPTGKAAMRMIESLRNSVEKDSDETKVWIENLKAFTLHSLLGYRRNSVSFKYSRSNPLPYDLIVVDEASMIDLPMMSKLLDAISEKGRLILLGDQNQLASVEAGSLLGDLCQSVGSLNIFSSKHREWYNQFIAEPARQITESQGTDENPTLLSDHITELKFSHRFNKLGKIGQLAKAVLGNNQDDLRAMILDERLAPQSMLWFDENYDEKLLEEFVLGFADFITEPDIRQALKKLGSLRILAAVREGKQGIYALNKKVEQILETKKLIHTGNIYYENRPILVTRNNYELGLMNGDIGILRPDSDGVMRVWFEDAEKATGSIPGLRSILPAYLSHVETTYAMTIHKSQGSEFEKIMIILPKDADHPILTRELLYTAITRAKQSVIISSSKEQIFNCASRQVKRSSGITSQLNQAVKNN